MVNVELEEARASSNAVLTGLARQCPHCGIVAHYEVKSRKPTIVSCPDCDESFIVKKFRRGERPK